MFLSAPPLYCAQTNRLWAQLASGRNLIGPTIVLMVLRSSQWILHRLSIEPKSAVATTPRLVASPTTLVVRGATARQKTADYR